MGGVDDLVGMAVFARVVEERSFTRAAARVGMAKSAVSKRVAALEAGLGVRLLQRTTRRLSLTPEGARFYEHCARMVEAAEHAEEAAREEAIHPRGTLRVSGPVAFGRMHLATLAADFLRENPGVDLVVELSDRFVDVVAEGFDLAVRIAGPSDSTLVARRLARDRLVVVAAPAYLERRGRPREAADLADHVLLHYSLAAARDPWRALVGRRARTRPIGGELLANDGSFLAQASAAGLGLSVAPTFLVAELVRAGRLEVVLPSARLQELDISAVWAHRASAPRRLRLFVDFLARRLGDTRWRRTALLPTSP